ncbi:MAG: hypothetical protein U0R18_05140 [Mycobacterium sp.]
MSRLARVADLEFERALRRCAVAAGCRRRATALLALACGCEMGAVCGLHLLAWLDAGAARELADEVPRCASCGHVFGSFGESHVVVSL